MFEKIIGILNKKVLSTIAAAALVLVMLITGADVIGRYALHRPVNGAYEISKLCMATIIFLGWGYTQAEKFHIDIDVLYAHLPRSVQLVFDILIPFLGLALFFFVGWQSINFISVSINWHETTDMLGIPLWLVKSFMLIGSVAISLQFLVDIFAACRIKIKAGT